MDVDEMLKRLLDVPGLDLRVRRLQVACSLAADRLERADVELAVRVLYQKHFGDSFGQAHFSVPDSLVCCGEVCLGSTEKGDSFFVRLKELNQHLAVFGRSGSGKTNFIYHFLRELYRNEIPFLITDWKADYSRLDFARLMTGIGDYARRPVHVLSVGRAGRPGLAINPLIPPEGVEPSIWLKKVCEVFTHSYMGGPRFEQIIRDTVDHFYREYGIYEGRRDRFPTLQEVKEHLEGKKPTGREAQWMQSVLSTLSSLCFGGTGQALNVSVQPDLSFILSENVVLELDDLSSADKVFVIETLLLWIRHHKRAQEDAGRLESAIILEEAHHLLRAKQEDEESIMDVTLREIRSQGIGVVVVDQMPSLISSVALANNFARLCLNLVLKEDKLKMAGCMGLDREQTEALGDLPIGTAVVKMQDRFTKPFKIRIPFVPVQKLSQSEILISPYAKLPDFGIPRFSPCTARILQSGASSNDEKTAANVFLSEKRLTGNDSPFFQQNGSEDAGFLTNDRISQNDLSDTTENMGVKYDNTPKLELEIKLLTDIARHPIRTITDRYTRLGIGARKGNLTKRYLVREGWINESIIHGKDNWVKLLALTPDGEAVLKKRNIRWPRNASHGGLEHKYWIQTIADHCCQAFGDDYEVLEEYPLGGGRTADVVVIHNGNLLSAIEVETGKSDIQANIDKYTELGASRVFVAFSNQQVLETFKDSLRIPPNVILTTVSKIVKTSNDELIRDKELFCSYERSEVV